jgi:hypothetical protein
MPPSTENCRSAADLLNMAKVMTIYFLDGTILGPKTTKFGNLSSARNSLQDCTSQDYGTMMTWMPSDVG